MLAAELISHAFRGIQM